ncbi:HNH endonuclease [Oceanirhabdus sp. W0125-5]|uniref:HNH endonuclease n=1 Tax=Oceanirhabdus sp. W0125-5 TaxID=2999116 RepID=UPI0022F2BA46|nr:HNH endonuclease [Oceanirhabdus sp. W0125-5]WBW98847.1 HNH endonuclease [Oceanirhabdus sp. W0125-5]
MKRSWIYPVDTDKYDVINSFKDLKEVDWEILNKMECGDIVYIYLGNDNKKIMIKTKVKNINVTKSDGIDDSAYVLESETENLSENTVYTRLKLLDLFSEEEANKLSYNLLLKNGLNGSIRSGLILNNNPELKSYIEDIEKNIIKQRIDNLNNGQIFSNEELMSVFKCANASGMRRAHKTNTLCIISDHTKSLYEDRWIEDVFHYTGMGQVGNQDLNYGQNITLSESNTNGVEVHLFEVFKKNEYIYEGKVELVDTPYQEEQLDAENNLRTVWVFPLKQVNRCEEIRIPKDVLDNKEKQREKMAKKLNNEQLRKKTENIKGKPGTRTTTTKVYERNADVAEYAKRVAKGICQLCEQPAPFKNKAGEDYLETHHIVWLSEGGEDTIYNTVALCPNCHKKMHVLKLKEDVEFLKEKIL